MVALWRTIVAKNKRLCSIQVAFFKEPVLHMRGYGSRLQMPNACILKIVTMRLEEFRAHVLERCQFTSAVLDVLSTSIVASLQYTQFQKRFAGS